MTLLLTMLCSVSKRFIAGNFKTYRTCIIRRGNMANIVDKGLCITSNFQSMLLYQQYRHH